MTPVLMAVCLVAYATVGLAVARWSWTRLEVYPRTCGGHLALGATSWVWPLLAAVVVLGVLVRPRFKAGDR